MRFNRAMAGRSRFDMEVERYERRLRAEFGRDLDRLLSDAGVTRAALAARAGVSEAALSRIGAGTRAPSFGMLARLAHAIDGQAQIRLLPGSGLPLRDRWSAPMIEATVRELGPCWTPHPEVSIFVPARGSVDLVLEHRMPPPLLVATEFVSYLRRLEQMLRWTAEKASGLARTELARRLSSDGPPSISRLLVIRNTRATRAVADSFAATLRAAYPGDPAAALAALRGTGPWSGAAILWMTATGSDAHFEEE